MKFEDGLRIVLGVTTLSTLFIIAAIAYTEFLKVAGAMPEGAPDIPAILCSYFVNPAKLADLWNQLLFRTDLSGSSNLIKYTLIPAILIPVYYVFQERIKIHTPNYPTIFYANYAYMAVLPIAIFLLQTMNGIAQINNLYWDPVANIAGRFDFATHSATGTTFFLCLLPVPWASWFSIEKLYRPASGYFDNLVNIAIIEIVSWYFEFNESLHPERYMNFLGNAQSDVVANVIVGFLVAYLIYSKLVDRYTRSYDSAVEMDTNGHGRTNWIIRPLTDVEKES